MICLIKKNRKAQGAQFEANTQAHICCVSNLHVSIRL